MVVDDVVVVGARPLLMTDHIACGRVVPERVADIVRCGKATAWCCRRHAPVGGETAEHPASWVWTSTTRRRCQRGVVEAADWC